MAVPNNFPDTNSNILHYVAESAKYKLKMFVEYTGFTSPLILAKKLSYHTTNEFLISSLDLSLYIAINLLMKLSVIGKDSDSVA